MGGLVTQVFAYLDPGSGSMILQLLAGGLAAMGVAIKLYWRRVLSFLRIRRPDDEPAPAPEQQRERSS
jgi:hypothetical protein